LQIVPSFSNQSLKSFSSRILCFLLVPGVSSAQLVVQILDYFFPLQHFRTWSREHILKTQRKPPHSLVSKDALECSSSHRLDGWTNIPIALLAYCQPHSPIRHGLLPAGTVQHRADGQYLLRKTRVHLSTWHQIPTVLWIFQLHNLLSFHVLSVEFPFHLLFLFGNFLLYFPFLVLSMLLTLRFQCFGFFQQLFLPLLLVMSPVFLQFLAAIIEFSIKCFPSCF
jgi:hypothetical protein